MLLDPSIHGLPAVAEDPVTGERFEPQKGTPRVLFRGRWYYFLGMESRLQFKREPERFAADDAEARAANPRGKRRFRILTSEETQGE